MRSAAILRLCHSERSRGISHFKKCQSMRCLDSADDQKTFEQRLNIRDLILQFPDWRCRAAVRLLAHTGQFVAEFLERFDIEFADLAGEGTGVKKQDDRTR